MTRLDRFPKNQQGFTLPELITVMVITIIFTSMIMVFTFDYWRGSASLQNDLETYVGRLNAGDRLRNYLNSASGLMSQNSLPDAHPNNPDTSTGSNTYWIPIHAVPGSIPVGAAGTTTPVIYFRQPALDTSKNIIMNGSTPYENEYVLYLDGTKHAMLLRTIANSAAPGDAAVSSCPLSLATASCPADKTIAENLSSVDMRYFSRTGNLIDYTSITDPNSDPAGAYIGPDFTAVEVVEFNLHTFKKSTLHGGQDTSSQTIIRIALRNG
jgi:prepilin-type N-terminal cleavage/methylation domain-containing protein